ncbi:MAG: NAD(P)-binding domain-containing protein [Blastocatellia bacterium]|nr:NAD(P)-binding domain-containing protein [Blastocatellia bacterium]
MYDLIIVGSGPSGLAAALEAMRHGLDYLVIERGVIANTLYHYPIARPLFSTADEVELLPGGLRVNTKPTREEVLTHYARVIVSEGIKVRTGEDVRHIVRTGEGFSVETDGGLYSARAVLVATGGFGRKRKLNVPGENDRRVSYSFSEAHPYAMKRVLVVGGGNSAAEAALFLSEAGASVTLSVRRPSLDRETVEGTGPSTAESRADSVVRAAIKPWVREPLERAISEGMIELFTSSQVIEILPLEEKSLPCSALLRVARDGKQERLEIECDHIFALIGADPDTRLLEDAGVELAGDGRPVYDPSTYETNVKGLYVAGHITRELHMKSAMRVARRCVDHIASQILTVT